MANETGKPIRKRSPNHPAINLKIATAKIEQIYENEKGQHFVPSETIFSHWGYNAKSSAGNTTLGALKQFGLLDAGSKEGRPGESKLSDLAMEILLDKDGSLGHRDEALKKAAMKPPLYAKILGDSGGSLPSDKTLCYQLIRDHGFSESRATDFIKEFQSTLAFAGITEDDTLRNGSEDGEAASSGPQRSLDEKNALPNTSKARPGMNQDTFTLDEGQVVLQWPASFSPENYEDLKDWLELMARRMKRAVREAKEETKQE